MKLKDGFILRKIADEYLVVAVGDKAKSFQGVVVLNEVSAFILENIRENITIVDLVNRIVEEYDVDSETASEDLNAFIRTLNEYGMLE